MSLTESQQGGSSATDPPPAWRDDEDGVVEQETPGFFKGGHSKPSWALSDTARNAAAELGDHEDDSSHPRRASEALARKRFRSEDLDTLLSRKEPLLTSPYDRSKTAVPKVLSVMPLPRDSARTIHWHRNGQLAIIGGNHHIYTFHAAGRFVEQLSKVDVGKRVEKTALTDNGEEVLVAAHEAYAPQLLTLATEQLIPLTFLDTRDTAVHRNGRSDNTKYDLFISHLICKPNDPACRSVAVARGATLTLASLSSGSVQSHITVDSTIMDATFLSATELAIATKNKVLLYDVRKLSRFTRELSDKAALDITSCAFSSLGGALGGGARTMAIGSASGVVSVYDSATLRPASGTVSTVTEASPKLLRELKQLLTPISCLSFGSDHQGSPVLAFATHGQKGGFRLARLPNLNVVPAFPAVSSHHGFVQSMVIAPTVPVLSVGERQKVTNYAL